LKPEFGLLEGAIGVEVAPKENTPDDWVCAGAAVEPKAGAAEGVPNVGATDVAPKLNVDLGGVTVAPN